MSPNILENYLKLNAKVLLILLKLVSIVVESALMFFNVQQEFVTNKMSAMV